MPFHDPLKALLARQPFALLDGAMATELEKRGCNLNDPLWSAKVLLEAPELIRDVHLDYLRAGADIITTASYQATFEGLAGRGLERSEAAALMRLSVQLALEARAQWLAEAPQAAPPLVAASVGPYGAMLADGSEYRGGYGMSVGQLMDFHRPRLAVLAAAGADLLACETLPCPEEAVALARLLAEELPQTAAWLAFSCKDGEHVSQGERLAACLALLEGTPQIVAVGINCTDPALLPALLASVRGATGKPLLVYPNSGEHYDPAGKCWHGQADAERVAEDAGRWREGGARLIGGCCRTGPAQINALRALRAAAQGGFASGG